MKQLLTYLSIIFFSSCIKSIPLEIDVSDPKIVVNTLITEDQNIKVYISSTSSILDTNIIEINPQVKLYEDNSLTATLEINSEGFYTTDYLLSSSKKYRLEVTDAGLGTCTAIDTIPEKIPISVANFYMPVGFDEYGLPYYQADIQFKDPPNTKNYYEILIYRDETNLPQYINNYITTNASIINEGDQEYLPTSLFFSDELFNGNTFEISIKFLSGYQVVSPDEYAPDGNYYVILRSISSVYYSYRKSWTRHAYNQTVSDDILGMFFKGEPIDAYTNVTNGYGIFAGYNEDIKQLTLINK